MMRVDGSPFYNRQLTQEGHEQVKSSAEKSVREVARGIPDPSSSGEGGEVQLCRAVLCRQEHVCSGARSYHQGISQLSNSGSPAMKKNARKAAATKTAGDESAIAACGPLPPDEARPADDASKLEKPQAHFEKAGDVAADEDLSRGEKKQALETWEQDARQLLTASNEGMPGKDEGTSPQDAPKLGEVVRAKAGIGEKPKPKSAH
jgi:hypothetical protein